MSLWQMLPTSSNDPFLLCTLLSQSSALSTISDSTLMYLSACWNDFATNAVNQVLPLLSDSPKALKDPSACLYVSSRW
uniref:Putative secreted protein n=1 Tax=Anopheles triannulatus TaxID=58253 RepID=A0A2M4B3E0_9DIPT